ncbi:ribokinase [Dellaglioa sp. L3N]
MNKITVIGSINVDTILRIPRLPLPGETLGMFDQSNAGGGKGANQVIAAARSGAKTTFIGKVGQDQNGDFMLNNMDEDGILTEFIVKSSEVKTGQAYILLDQEGENSILLYAGANNKITDTDVKAAYLPIRESDFIVGQLESNVSATILAFEEARKFNVITILNPAPAKEKISAELLSLTDVIVPNETESEIITGIKVEDEESQIQAAKKMLELGVKIVVITLGSKGAFYYTSTGFGMVPAFKVKAVDTTAAGDTFIGAMISKLSPDFSNLEEAIRFGNKASSLTVQKLGAQPSIPYLKDIE